VHVRSNFPIRSCPRIVADKIRRGQCNREASPPATGKIMLPPAQRRATGNCTISPSSKLTGCSTDVHQGASAGTRLVKCRSARGYLCPGGHPSCHGPRVRPARINGCGDTSAPNTHSSSRAVRREREIGVFLPRILRKAAGSVQCRERRRPARIARSEEA